VDQFGLVQPIDRFGQGVIGYFQDRRGRIKPANDIVRREIPHCKLRFAMALRAPFTVDPNPRSRSPEDAVGEHVEQQSTTGLAERGKTKLVQNLISFYAVSVKSSVPSLQKMFVQTGWDASSKSSLKGTKALIFARADAPVTNEVGEAGVAPAIVVGMI